MIYLNNAATSYPKATGLGEFMAGVYNSIPGDANRATYRKRLKSDARTSLAELMEVSDKRRVIYTGNATHALNTAILGFPFNRGDVVLTTAAEHNAVLRPLHYLKKRGVIDYCVLPVDKYGRLKPETLRAACERYKPRLVAFTHASNVTGAVNDVPALSAIAGAYCARVLLDASQTMGLVPVTPLKWNVDMTAFTGHKYLLGPQGTGGLYVADGVELTPVITGGTGIHSDDDEMPSEYPRRLEAGTPNEQGFEGLMYALEYARENPVDTEAIVSKAKRLEQGLEALGCKTISPDGPRTPVVAFYTDVMPADDIGYMLNVSYDILCRTGLHCAPFVPSAVGAPKTGTVRMSLSRYTTDDEIDEVLNAMGEVLSD